MKIPDEHKTIQRFLSALIVHFLHTHTEGFIRFMHLASAYPAMDGKWWGVEFADASAEYRPILIIPLEIFRLVEQFVTETTQAGEHTSETDGFYFEAGTRIGAYPLIRKITVVFGTDETRDIQFLLSTVPAEDLENHPLPVLRISKEDKLPLGLDYLWTLSINLELKEFDREPDTNSVGSIVRYLLESISGTPAAVHLTLLPYSDDNRRKPNKLLAVIQLPEDKIQQVFLTLLPVNRYLIPILKKMCGLPPQTKAPVSGTLEYVSGSRNRKENYSIRFDLLDDYEIAVLRL